MLAPVISSLDEIYCIKIFLPSCLLPNILSSDTHHLFKTPFPHFPKKDTYSFHSNTRYLVFKPQPGSSTHFQQTDIPCTRTSKSTPINKYDSSPASAQAIMEATPQPDVSWVCTWIGRSGYWARKEPTSNFEEEGFRRPAMSLIQSTWVPALTNSSANFM